MSLSCFLFFVLLCFRYVRFWTVRGRALRFDLDEEGALLTKAMLAHSYRDRILEHDVVQDFYKSSQAVLQSAEDEEPTN